MSRPNVISKSEFDQLFGSPRSCALLKALTLTDGCYSVPEVDALLQKCNPLLHNPPTVAYLRGQAAPVLCDFVEAARQLRLTTAGVDYAIRRREVEAFKIGMDVRITVASVQALAEKREDALSFSHAARLLDVSRPRLTRFVQAGEIKSFLLRTVAYVSKTSLLEFLRRCLPKSVPAEAWLQQRMHGARWLINEEEAASRIKVTSQQLDKIIKLGLLWAVKYPGDEKWRTTAESLERYHGFSLISVDAEMISVVYGMTMERPGGWALLIASRCSIPGHNHAASNWLRLTCLWYRLQKDSGSALDAAAWIDSRICAENPTLVPVYNIKHAVVVLKTTRMELIALAENGEIAAIRTIFGYWRFPATSLP